MNEICGAFRAITSMSCVEDIKINTADAKKSKHFTGDDLYVYNDGSVLMIHVLPDLTLAARAATRMPSESGAHVMCMAHRFD